MIKIPLAALAMIACSMHCLFAQTVTTLQVPGRDRYTQIIPGGTSVLPSGRLLTPAGKVTQITHDPFGLTVSPDGKRAATLHNGVVTLIDLEKNTFTRIPDYQKTLSNPFPNGSLLGAAFHEDNRTLYLSGGDSGTVIVFDCNDLRLIRTFSLNGVTGDSTFGDSFTSDLLYVKETHELLVLDQANYRLVRMDATTGERKASIPTGRLPFGLALSDDGETVLVANVGMYAYPIIEGLTQTNYNDNLIDRHPYAHNSPESIQGTMIDGKRIPGVGDPNHPDAMSVFTIDLRSNTVIHKIKTGNLIGKMIEDAEVIGGSSPNSIALHEGLAYVTNATNDNISVINYHTGKVIRHIPIRVDPRLDKFRGLLPFGISVNKAGTRLYVALLGMNAVAVIDTRQDRTIGLIPTGWGPTRVKLSPDEKELYITSCRGLGAGPNGGKDFTAPVQGTYVGDIQLASFQRVSLADSDVLSRYTLQVVQNTLEEVPVTVSDNPLPPLNINEGSPIKHIVYITKENRTYDEVLGQLASGKGDSSLARFGLRVNIAVENAKKQATAADNTQVEIRNAHITPNHQKIARQFSYSDNFYCDSDASIHGHHWMMGVIPNEWVETNSNTSKTARIFSQAPGRRFPGSTGSMDPEDFAETGGLWEALERKGVSFYNFGEANETAHVREEWSDTATGAAHAVMVPMQKALWSRTSHNYAGYNTNIPDQFRMDQFESEFKRLWLTGKEKMPSLVTVQIPNDHTASPRKEDGYPFVHSYVADNDLAVGRILHFLSRTPYWKNMLVIITEDDPQGGVDHIDAHRSILLLAGPYVKRNYVSHTHANFGSILKMIYNIFRVPYVNQYDVTASYLGDFFTPIPDYSPYHLEFPDKRVFDPAKAMKKYNRNTDWRKVMKGPEMDDEDELRERHYKGER
jgi:YVTN family beta-propeller protein